MNAIAITIHPTKVGIHILSNRERPCPYCKRPSTWWVNHEGRTACLRCTEPGRQAPLSLAGVGTCSVPDVHTQGAVVDTQPRTAPFRATSRFAQREGL